MKLNGTFALREVVGEILVIPLGETALNMNGMIVLNPVSKVIWEHLAEGTTEEELLQAITDEFDVELQEAKADLAEFLNELRKYNFLSE